jgi:nitrogen fixation/metabolism regulation signal transduction histidine kinase
MIQWLKGRFNNLNYPNGTSKNMIKGNFIGAAIVAIIYTVYILMNYSAMHSKTAFVLALVILNALTIVLLSFAFKG